WGMSFPHGLVPTTQTCVAWGWPANCRVQPTPIYEFAVACIVAWALWKIGGRQIRSQTLPRVTQNGRLTQMSPPEGSVFAAYLVLTGVARFLVEFIRINPRSFFGLTNAQVASLVSIVAGVALWMYLANRTKRREKRSGSFRGPDASGPASRAEGAHGDRQHNCQSRCPQLPHPRRRFSHHKPLFLRITKGSRLRITTMAPFVPAAQCESSPRPRQ
ncbi:MAG TPA: prolipoprotein diacylglyceryl transferase family protein, partial [Candidatus Aquilonibacter sp.]|nr:prolipoprotein diacylglyceryl transferase family protein [Candidatus Aquilonibacter sp.]